jgi:hypothetical protein
MSRMKILGFSLASGVMLTIIFGFVWKLPNPIFNSYTSSLEKFQDSDDGPHCATSIVVGWPLPTGCGVHYSTPSCAEVLLSECNLPNPIFVFLNVLIFTFLSTIAVVAIDRRCAKRTPATPAALKPE